jgi:arylsulfatase A-like enzyme
MPSPGNNNRAHPINMERQSGRRTPDDPGPRALAAHGAAFAVWLGTSFAVGAYLSGDRYPSYYIVWTLLLLAAGLVVPLVTLAVAARRIRTLNPTGPFAAAFCVLCAAALSVDVAPGIGGSPRLGPARLLLLAASAALAVWSIRRARWSRLSLELALLIQCAAWIVCGLLRGQGFPQASRNPSVLVPVVTSFLVLMPGLPRLDPSRSASRRLWTLVACAVLALLPLRPPHLMPSEASSARTGTPAGGRSAILIVLDTLRRDHMSLHGYSRKTTPAIDERARGAVVFDDATAVSSWTLPSHASMFTGLWPRSHGAYAFRNAGLRAVDVYPLPQERVTLAEIAVQAGYRTAGLTANHSYLARRLGMDQGFQDYLCRPPRGAGLLLHTARTLARRWDWRRAEYEEMPYFTAPEMTRAAISWLDRSGGAPFFLFLNYMDVHWPNAAPGSQGLPFEDEAPLGAPEKRILERPHPAGIVTPAIRRALVNEYDRELIHLDEWIGVLFDYLERSGLAKTTLVILTSDHGEYLGEHNLVGHGKDLYAEGVDVPLIVWEPGQVPGRVSRPVQSLDVFPTILRYLGLRVPESTQGQPLLEVEHPVVSQLSQGQGWERMLRTIRVGEYRYFQGPDGDERLFHLAHDPGERTNLAAQLPEQTHLARAQLDEWLLRVPRAPLPSDPAPEVDARALEELRTLGYVN